MKPKLLFLFLLLALIKVSAQTNNASKYNIAFKKGDKDDTIRRSKDKEALWSTEILASDNKSDEVKNNTIEIFIDEDNSTFPSNQCEILSNVNSKKLEGLAYSNSIRIIIKKESEAFKQMKPLKLVLKIKIRKPKKGTEDKAADDDPLNNVGKPTEIILTILPSEEQPLSSYKYLGYLGTNFDIVEGKPQVKNLFFATNIFIPEKKRWGFSIGIYGNRSFTRTDTSRQTTFESKIDRLNDSTTVRSFDSAKQVTNRVSDNIGAYFMPLIPIKFLSEGPLRLYYAPQFEFIWRKTTLDNFYLDNKTVRNDTARNRFPANTAFPLITPLNTKVDFNVYDAYVGFVGLLLRYETEDISVRLNSSVGVNFNYVPIGGLSETTLPSGVSSIYPTYDRQNRWFFFGRLWITEPTTGLTLGAEISNYFGYRHVGSTKISRAQPYYNVTLSKAFDLKNLVSVVKPLSSR